MYPHGAYLIHLAIYYLSFSLDGYPVSVGGYCYELCSLYVGGEDHGAPSSAPVEKALGMFTSSSVLSGLVLVLNSVLLQGTNKFRSVNT